MEVVRENEDAIGIATIFGDYFNQDFVGEEGLCNEFGYSYSFSFYFRVLSFQEILSSIIIHTSLCENILVHLSIFLRI